MKQLTREDFENLPVGSKINTLDNRLYKFNHIINDLVFMISSENKVSIVTIDYMNQHYYTIQKPKQYYKGWEVRSYEGENVWIRYSDYNSDCSDISKCAVLLKEVTIDGFISDSKTKWKYAIQYTDINTTPMCDETKIHD